MTFSGGTAPRRASTPGHRLGRLAIVALALTVGSCGPSSFKSYSYRDITLDLAKLTVTPVAPFGYGVSCPTPQSECYSRFTDAKGRHLITHYRAGRTDDPAQRVIYNFFSTSPDYRLITRAKHQLLLSGAFGNIYAISTFFYAPEYGRGRNVIEVRSYLSDVGFEPPEDEGATSEDLPLTAVSLVRVFRHRPEFLVISADYAPAGELLSFHVNAVSGGVWTNQPGVSGVPDLEVGVTTIGDRSPHRRTFGFPSSFPVREYLQSPHRVWEPAAHAEYLSVVTVHYGGTRRAIQHHFVGDAVSMTRRLRFRQTREDDALAVLDTSRGFGR